MTARRCWDDGAMDVQLLVIPNCPNEQQAREQLRRPLEVGAGDTPIGTVTVTTAAQAEQLTFAGSPTIMLDRVDPFPLPQRCPGLACRMYTQPGGPEGVPEMAALVAAIRRSAVKGSSPEADCRPGLDRRSSAVVQSAIDVAAGR